MRRYLYFSDRHYAFPRAWYYLYKRALWRMPG